MKLLFDENLSPMLSSRPSDLHPGSLHARDAGLDRGIDTNVWEFARENGFVIVSKDSDFNRMSAGRGHPPKVIWLRAGNCPAREIENRLRSQPPVIHAFEEKPDRSLLVLP